MKPSPGPRRAVLTAASTALTALALMMSPGPAQAETGGALEAGKASVTPLAPECGFYRYSVRESQFAAYGHCGETTILVHVDVRGGGSGNDYHLCVGPGQTQLPGAGPNYLNAYYIGGAGCQKGSRTPHTSH